MGRWGGGGSYGHRAAEKAGGDYELSWVVDRYVRGSRLRFPTVYRRWTDRAGAERFAKKWGVEIAMRKGKA